LLAWRVAHLRKDGGGTDASRVMNEQEASPAEVKLPLVSAIMITGKSPEREPLARVAVEAFTEQTYARKELIIVNHGGRGLNVVHREVHEIKVPVACRLTLGDLRNLGLSAAAGEWVIQWDDDDWHGAERIADQLRHAEPSAAVLLRSQIRRHLRTGTAWVFTMEGGIDGTILHHKQVPFKYPSLARREDTEFLKHFKKRMAVSNEADLYVRFFHGTNTWSEKHIMGHFAGHQNEVRLTPAQREHLFDVVLPRYRRTGVYYPLRHFASARPAYPISGQDSPCPGSAAGLIVRSDR
jgi:glycosyltransferase involved in cell wall biosynthesis